MKIIGTAPRTRVVNIKKGHEYDVYCGRAGKGKDGYFGNPYSDGTRERNISRFKAWFLDRVEWDHTYRERVLLLRGKRLGCFCYPEDCHVQVIIDWLDVNV